MRAIWVDPKFKQIHEVNVNIDDYLELSELVKDPTFGHIAFRNGLPQHDAYVDPFALEKKLTAWYFAGSLIWGPALILYSRGDAHRGPATVSVDYVRQHTRWA